MNVQLKSKELISAFGNNGLITPAIAQKQFNHIEIRIFDGKISDELLDDVYAIFSEFPELFRHTTIKNNSRTPVNLQKMVNLIAEEQKHRRKPENIFEMNIESSYPEDLNLDFGVMNKVNKVNLRNKSKNMAKLDLKSMHFSNKVSGLGMEGIDLASIDLAKTPIRSVYLYGNNDNFAAMSGKENITELNVNGTTNDQEFPAIFDFVRKSKSLFKLGILNSNLSKYKVFEETRNPNITDLVLYNDRIASLDGLEYWNDKLSFLNIGKNKLSFSDIEKINEFRKRNPLTNVRVQNIPEIDKAFDTFPEREFSIVTYSNIKNYFTNEHTSPISKENALRDLFDNEYIPYGISDAEVVRGKAKITLNPMVLEGDKQLETIDFNAPYIKGGTLLLTVSQFEKLIASNKTLPVNIGIRIKDASELTAEKTKELYDKYPYSEIRMVGPDLSDNQRSPYKPQEYYRSRKLLDEVVSGIDAKESDLDKFTTVYTRLANSIYYDTESIKNGNSKEVRYTRDQVNNSRNLVNGLVKGTCVCAGYAETLRNALSLVGIRARYIRGDVYDDPDKVARHAWSQVEIADEKGEKQWYYADLTWDEQVSRGKKGVYNYLLLDEDHFKTNHKRTFTPNVSSTPKAPYNRKLVEESLRKAKERYINPRDAYNAKMEALRKQKEEERKKALEAEKNKGKEKEEPKEEPKEVKKKSTDESLAIKAENLDELEKLLNKRDRYRKDLNDIYDLINSNKDLSKEKLRVYVDKIDILEANYKRYNDKVIELRKTLIEKERKEIEAKKQEVEKLKQEEKENVVPVSKEKSKKKQPVKAEQNYLDKAKDMTIEELKSKIANREAVIYVYSDKVNPHKQVELEEWKKQLAELEKGNLPKEIEDKAREIEKEELKSKIANREAMIAGRGNELNPARFTELEEWKKRLSSLDHEEIEVEEPIEEPKKVVDNSEKIAQIEKEIKEREERVSKLLKDPEDIGERKFDREALTQEQYDKNLKEKAKEIKEYYKEQDEEQKTFGKSTVSQVQLVKTVDELKKTDKALRVKHDEEKVLDFTNRVLHRNDEKLPGFVTMGIKARVSIAVAIRDAVYKARKGVSIYESELNAIRSVAPIVKNQSVEGQRHEFSKRVFAKGKKPRNQGLTAMPHVDEPQLEQDDRDGR